MPTTSGQPATSVFGQPDFTTVLAAGGAGTSASTISSVQGLYADGLRVFLADEIDERILIVPAF